jgi:transcription initiation factor IIE alpha subunit
MATRKYSGEEVTEEGVKNVLGSFVCFKCGKELHTDDCSFAKLRAELNALIKEKR